MLLDLIDSLWRVLLPRRDEKPDHVVVFASRRWKALAEVRDGAPVWDGIPGVAQVEVAHKVRDLFRIGRRTGWRCIVIPFRERFLRFCPRIFWGLMPSRRALATCRNKARFHRFAQRHGLSDLLPRHYPSAAGAQFPCVMKLPATAGGHGVAFVDSAAEFERRRRQEPWRGRPVLLQEAVPGAVDYATHCVCKDGQIVWHCTYRYQLDPAIRIQSPRTILERRRVLASLVDIEQMERFVRALRYEGPASFDYRRRDDGRLIIFEINPRFGGSMTRPETTEDLREGLAALVANAVPPGPSQR